MDFTHKEVFRIRHYECDLYGHVNNAVYMHFLHETALSALRAVGMNQKHLAEMGLREWMTAIDIEYLTPLYYGETVEVTYHPSGILDGYLFGRFEFQKTISQELAARAVANTVFLCRANGVCAPIPELLVKAFFPVGIQDPPQNLISFSAAPPPPPGMFKTHRK
jgi:YbgC/YbaW family acyl-CoA thioester hydrolase